MTTTRRAPVDRSRIARAIFAAAESMGISDRILIEQLTNQVLQRLEGRQPLPGMENLLQETGKRKLSETEIQAAVKEVLAEKSPPPPVSPKVHQRPQLGAPQLGANALTVLERRYLNKDEQGKVIETPEQMFRRVAHNIALAELIYNPNANIQATEEDFYQAIASLDFLPNSPTLMNAGRELQQLSACFVLPIDDSMESIFDAVKYTALIQKSGGGTGFSFNRLRPEGDIVGSTKGVASGPVSFMKAFDITTEVTKQGGTRRGANMAILNIDHPDILKFVTAKEDAKAFTNFNLSVAMNSQFMEAVKKEKEYDLVNPRTKKIAKQLKAKEVFDKIVDTAWRTGDPGIVFLDRINRDNPTPRLGSIESTNPCGEQPLLPYESCNLGSINLSRMLRPKDGGYEIDYDKLARTINTAVRFLDNVIDMNKFPLAQIKERTLQTRKIGLGVMGFADMLILLGIPYDSDEGLKTAEAVMSFLNERATQASVEMAKERGVFPAFEGSIYDNPGAPRVRNAARTTIAPTGTLSIIAGCSSGIEPLFALSYVRNVLDGDQLLEANPHFEEAARKEGFYSPELMKKLAEGASLRDMKGIPEKVKKLFVTAHDITPEGHVRMQAAFQRHTDNAVSKTVNFPHSATRDDVAKVYLLAYEEGLKGITIYRDRSRDQQVLSTARKEKAEEGKLTPRKRPKIVHSYGTEQVSTGCGNLYVTVNYDERGPFEVFSTLGKAGGCASGQLEAISRLISLALRAGVEASAVVKHLRGIRCPSIAWEDGHAVLSCADAIGSVLEKHLPGAEKTTSKPVDYGLARSFAGQCPECGSLLVYQEGCYICPSCAYTKC